MENIAIILAGGIGSRMHSNTPKQFLKIKGKEIILYSLETFSKCDKVDGIIVVCHKDYIFECNNIISKAGITKIVSIVEGGLTRQESVLNGLSEAKRLFDVCNVLVHDSARPFVSEKIILDNINALEENDCCTTAIPSTDSVYKVEDGKVKEGLKREEIYLAQTPQGGKLDVLLDALKGAKEIFTDEASLLSYVGLKPLIIKGDMSNKKVTVEEDILGL